MTPANWLTLAIVASVPWLCREFLAGFALRALQEWRLAHGRYPDGTRRDTGAEPKKEG